MSYESSQEYNYAFSAILVGDSGVGKSQLLSRYVEDKFSETHKATIGFDSRTKIIKVDGINVKLQIWDTAGKKRLISLSTWQYKAASAALLVYDVTQQKTFNSLKSRLEEVRGENSKAPIFLVGNKSDLEQQRQVPENKPWEWAEGNGVTFLGEVSAKDGTSVENVFQEMVVQAMDEALHEALREQEEARREKLPEETNKVKEIGTQELVCHSHNDDAPSASSPRASARWTVGRAVMALAGGVALGVGAAVLGMFAFPMKVLIGVGALAGLAAWGAYEVVNCGYKGCTSSEMGLCHSAWNNLPSPLACCSPSKDGEVEMELVKSDNIGLEY